MLGDKLSATLSWQFNQKLPEPEDYRRGNPAKLLQSVKFKPATLGAIAYPSHSAVYVLQELLASYIVRQYALPLDTPIEIGKAHSYKFIRLSDGRAWAEKNNQITIIRS